MSDPKLLLVEDEMMIAMVIEEVLREAGYDVIHALNGSEALNELERHAKDFAVVCTDIKLPGTLSGWDVGRRARELHPRVGLVYASGDSAEDWQKDGLPGSLFLQKPYSNAELVMAVSKSRWV